MKVAKEKAQFKKNLKGFAETPIELHRNGISRLTMVSWFCVLWSFVAICVIWGTIDNIDFDGATKKEYLPYESLIACIVYTGYAAISVGFGSGLWALLFRKNFGVPLLPTLILGLLLIALAFNWYQAYQWNIQSNGQSPTVNVDHEFYPQ